MGEHDTDNIEVALIQCVDDTFIVLFSMENIIHLTILNHITPLNAQADKFLEYIEEQKIA